MSFSPAARRYSIRVIVLSLIYCAFLLPAVYAFKHHLVSGPIARTRSFPECCRARRLSNSGAPALIGERSEAGSTTSPSART